MKHNSEELWNQLNAQAFQLYQQGQFNQAFILAKQALELAQSIYQGDHPNIASTLNNLARLLIKSDRPTEALELMQQAIAMDDRLLRASFAYSSERDRLTYIDNIRDNFDGFLSLISTYFSDSPDAVKIALDVVLQRKCITATALAQNYNRNVNKSKNNSLPKFQKFNSKTKKPIDGRWRWHYPKVRH